MSKEPNHQADISNGNWGSSGTNKTWDQAHGNRGKQMNPNQPANNSPRPSSTDVGDASGSQRNKR